MRKIIVQRLLPLMLFPVLLCFPSLAFVGTGFADLLPDNDAQQKNLDLVEIIPGHFVSCEIAELMENQAESSKLALILRASGFDDSSSRNYPWHPAFGGMYLDEKGILVVCIVDDDAQLKGEIASLLGDAQYYFRNVTYSWNYLTEIQEAISEFLGEHWNKSREELLKENLVITGLNANQEYNNVTVYLLNLTEESMILCRGTVIDSPAITFEQGEFPVPLLLSQTID